MLQIPHYHNTHHDVAWGPSAAREQAGGALSAVGRYMRSLRSTAGIIRRINPGFAPRTARSSGRIGWTSLKASSQGLSKFAISALVLLVLVACKSSSDNGEERGPWVFVSDEGPDYIVNLVTSPYKDDSGNIAYRKLFLRTTLPRDILSICFPYSRRGGGPFKVESLPDEVFCNKIGFAIYYDDGKPVWRSKSREERDAVRNRTSDPLAFGKVPSAEFRRTLNVKRFSTVAADVFPIGPEWFDHLQFVLADGRIKNELGEYKGSGKYIGDYEGFREYQDGPRFRNYLDSKGRDGIYAVKCLTPIEGSHPEFYCTAYVDLNDNIGAELTFIDFRLHGGRAFLRERIAAWKSHMCEALHCNPPTSVEDKQ